MPARQRMGGTASVRRGELPPGTRLDRRPAGAPSVLRARERAELRGRSRERRRQRRPQSSGRRGHRDHHRCRRDVVRAVLDSRARRIAESHATSVHADVAPRGAPTRRRGALGRRRDVARPARNHGGRAPVGSLRAGSGRRAIRGARARRADDLTRRRLLPAAGVSRPAARGGSAARLARAVGECRLDAARSWIRQRVGAACARSGRHAAHAQRVRTRSASVA
jgi:hypothetical protein